MSSPARPAFQRTYIGWFIAAVIVIVCVLALIGVPIPAEPKTFFAMIGALALAMYFV